MKENLIMALQAIRANKLRSGLTILGITVGVFSIIVVMTAMGVFQYAIESGLSVLGSNTFQIQKFPAVNFSDPRLKFRNRKDITFEQGKVFMERMKHAKHMSLEAWVGIAQVVYRHEKTNPDVTILGETEQGFLVNNWPIQQGRSFTDRDLESVQYVCVLGSRIVDKLFPHASPVGEYVRINGARFRVIGTIEPKGSILGGTQDNHVVIPLTTALSIYGKQRSINIIVQAFDRESYPATLELARGTLRTIRRVSPGAPDDFEIFSSEMLIGEFNHFTFLVKIGTAGLACIALLAAGVGIMNIMLVSVTERIKEIGIRKALGATRGNILGQFLTESVVFCQIGGIAGIVAGSLVGNSVALFMQSPPVMPWNTSVAILQTPLLSFTALEINLLALFFCSLIGTLFGVYPAWKAANLNPVESLRYE